MRKSCLSLYIVVSWRLFHCLLTDTFARFDNLNSFQKFLLCIPAESMAYCFNSLYKKRCWVKSSSWKINLGIDGSAILKWILSSNSKEEFQRELGESVSANMCDPYRKDMELWSKPECFSSQHLLYYRFIIQKLLLSHTIIVCSHGAEPESLQMQQSGFDPW